jgi:hypothetical protein
MVEVLRTDVKMRTLLSVEKCGCYVDCRYDPTCGVSPANISHP